MKSNLGVFEEAWRISAETFREACCPEPLCGNHCVPTSTEGAYYRFGSTDAGSARFRCRACRKTFSVKPAGRNPIARQIRSDKNPMSFRCWQTRCHCAASAKRRTSRPVCSMSALARLS
jgi:hypothetical protein